MWWCVVVVSVCVRVGVLLGPSLAPAALVAPCASHAAWRTVCCMLHRGAVGEGGWRVVVVACREGGVGFEALSPNQRFNR